MIKIICFLVLLLALSASADAGQVGRTTEAVRLRKGPAISEAQIRWLPAGGRVEIIKREPTGWYFVIVEEGRQPGYVHQRYIMLEQPEKHSSKHNGPVGSRLDTVAGIILIGIGCLAILAVAAPFLFRVGLILFGCLLWVLVWDIAFKIGMLYSLISVGSVLLIVLALLTRKKKQTKISLEDISPTMKKAA